MFRCFKLTYSCFTATWKWNFKEFLKKLSLLWDQRDQRQKTAAHTHTHTHTVITAGWFNAADKQQKKKTGNTYCLRDQLCVFSEHSHVSLSVEALQVCFPPSVSSRLVTLHRLHCTNKSGNMAINRKTGGLPTPTSPYHTTSYWTNTKGFNSFLPSAVNLY